MKLNTQISWKVWMPIGVAFLLTPNYFGGVIGSAIGVGGLLILGLGVAGSVRKKK
jgi:hypothetical protein